jgi:phenylalanyl-tRNA synthetase alpha chain
MLVRDLTDPAQGPHALQLIVDRITDNLAEAWPVQVRTHRADPVVSLADNYDNLGYPADAVTREARYTRYVDDGHVLRSHTSAIIPGALRRLAVDRQHDDVLLVCPGVCYRRDSVDWQHTGTPQQLDLWRITRGPQEDLHRMIALVVEAALPGLEWRAVPSEHPYTTEGRQIDVRWNDDWIEIGECGLAAAHVLNNAGLGKDWTGLAMGLGLDRILMLVKGIPDIRLLRSADPRIASQMLDLAPYRPVSHLPPIRRDLSLVMSERTEVTAEALGDRVREALGDEADAVETVAIAGITSYADLPAQARDRLGIRRDQRNVLVRLILRPLDRTLTDAEANVLRDRVYAELHEGAVAEWAT